MNRKYRFWKTFVFLAFSATSSFAFAQSAGTSVDVGPGHAGASGSASGQWQMVETDSRVHGGGSMGRALAVGMGPNGLAISHSIGLNGAGTGVGHNFNMSIGANGTHVSHGGVVSQGGNSRVIAGGQVQNGPFGQIQGGSTVGGFGNVTRAHTQSQTVPFFRGGPAPMRIGVRPRFGF